MSLDLYTMILLFPSTLGSEPETRAQQTRVTLASWSLGLKMSFFKSWQMDDISMLE